MRLKASDGHEFEAYVSETWVPAKAAAVIIQEIFGVNEHIRSVADDYAKQGYWAIAPALFDRVERVSSLATAPMKANEVCKSLRASGWASHSRMSKRP